LWIAARYAGRIYPQSISRTNATQENGGEMQLVLRVCGNCGWSSFEPCLLFGELRWPDGRVDQICPKCMEALAKRYRRYEIAPEILEPSRKVKHVKR
jgi:hypothetical protein